MKESLHVVAFKLQTLNSLQPYRLLTFHKSCEYANHVAGGFTLHGFRPSPPAKHVNHSQYVFEAIIVTGIGLHVHKIGLPLVVDTTRYIVTRRIALPRWLVERV